MKVTEQATQSLSSSQTSSCSDRARQPEEEPENWVRKTSSSNDDDLPEWAKPKPILTPQTSSVSTVPSQPQIVQTAVVPTQRVVSAPPPIQIAVPNMEQVDPQVLANAVIRTAQQDQLAIHREKQILLNNQMTAQMHMQQYQYNMQRANQVHQQASQRLNQAEYSVQNLTNFMQQNNLPVPTSQPQVQGPPAYDFNNRRVPYKQW